jgi:hypothetical protein
MNGWSHDELERIGDAEELELASRRDDGTLRPYVTMWVVRADDNLYVRSAYGPDNPWYRRAKQSGIGRIRAGGIEHAVTFTEADETTNEEIDRAYDAKYDRYGPGIVASVTGAAAHPLTIQLRSQPNPTSGWQHARTERVARSGRAPSATHPLTPAMRHPSLRRPVIEVADRVVRDGSIARDSCQPLVNRWRVTGWIRPVHVDCGADANGATRPFRAPWMIGATFAT